MFIPSQGFRHAATLLLTNSIRALPHDGSPTLVTEALARLARDLVALSEDTRVPADAAEWTREEYRQTLCRALEVFSHRTDADFTHLFETATVRGLEILEGVGMHRPADSEPRDLFLMYVPEDRLPVAAPLAIELTKRRFTVAFSDHEIDTMDQMTECLERGLHHHRAGALLVTPGFIRRQWPAPDETVRFRVLRKADPVATANDLAVWLRSLRPRR